MSKTDNTIDIEREDLREYFTYEILRRNLNLKRGDPMKNQIEMAYNGKIFKSKKKRPDDDEKTVGIFFTTLDNEVLLPEDEEEDVAPTGDKKLARPVMAKEVGMCLFVDKKSTNIKDALRIKDGKFLHPYKCITSVTVDPVKNHPICKITYSFGISNE